MKESVEGVAARVWLLGGGVQRHAIRTDVVLQAEELPASVSYLDPRLSHMDGDDLSLPGSHQKIHKYSALVSREGVHPANEENLHTLLIKVKKRHFV